MEKLPAQELKEQLGDKAKDIIINRIMPEKKGKKIKCLIPTHQDENPSMEWYEQGNTFNCFSCGGTFDIYDYFQEYEGMSFIESVQAVGELLGRSLSTAPIDKKTKETLNETEFKDINYLEKRGMSKKTIKHFNVKDMGDEIAFIYYDLFGDIVGVKYRNIKQKKFRAETNSNFNLYNMINIDESFKELYIVEGEIDAMTLYECGIPNVVSIPTGARSTSWITDNWEFLQRFETFVVIFDNDEAGKTGQKETINRLGETKVKVAELPKNKDINDVYLDNARDFYRESKKENMTEEEKTQLTKASFKYSQTIVEDLISSAEFIPISGLENFDNIDMSTSKSEYYISTGFYGIDNHLNDLQDGEITIIFGRENEGKTTFTGQIINSIVDQGEKVFWYNGEMKTKKLKSWLYSQAIGDNPNQKYYKWKKVNKAWEKVFHQEALNALSKWHKDKIYMFNSYSLTNHNDIYEKIIASYKRYRTKIVVIDNLATILDNHSENQNSIETEFIKKLNEIKKRYGMHFIIVAHPNKYKKKGEILDTGDISGSKNISNLVDNIISVMRIYKGESGEYELGGKTYSPVDGNNITLRTDILKDRNIGKRQTYLYRFDEKSKRFIELAKDEYGKKSWVVKNYSWKDYGDETLEFWNGETQTMSKKDADKIKGE